MSCFLIIYIESKITVKKTFIDIFHFSFLRNLKLKVERLLTFKHRTYFKIPTVIRVMSSFGPSNAVSNQLRRTLRSPRFNVRNIFLGLAFFFVVRNLLRNDYRQEEIKYLRQHGMEEEEIENYIPKTAVERKKYAEEQMNDVVRMKKDIIYLMKEVEDLKAGRDSERENTLKSMDKLHEEKRRNNEKQLLKDYPNFKPSKRLSDLSSNEVENKL